MRKLWRFWGRRLTLQERIEQTLQERIREDGYHFKILDKTILFPLLCSRESKDHKCLHCGIQASIHGPKKTWTHSIFYSGVLFDFKTNFQKKRDKHKNIEKCFCTICRQLFRGSNFKHSQLFFFSSFLWNGSTLSCVSMDLL